MTNTKTTRTSRNLGDAGGEYQVMTDKTELPRGSFFTALAGVHIEAGDLVMFSIGRRKSIGRWLPDVGGHEFILQPGLLIALVGAQVRIVGKVIAIEPLKVCQTGRIKAGPQSRN